MNLDRRRRLGLEMTRASLRCHGPWVLAVAAACAAVPAVVARFTDIGVSAWGIGAHSGKIFTAIVLGTWVYAMLTATLAKGVTRREYTGAAALLALAWSAVLGTLATVGYFAEHAYYRAFGWDQTVSSAGPGRTLDTWGETAAFAAPHLPVYLLFAFAGSMIGAAAYRWEGYGWLIALPVAVLAFTFDNAVLTTEAFGPGWLRTVTGFAVDLHVAVAVSAALAAAGLGAIAVWRLLADVPVRNKQA